ncbi:MAG: hypothetical protein ACLSFZ_00935 [Frisingicoccus sp.]
MRIFTNEKTEDGKVGISKDGLRTVRAVYGYVYARTYREVKGKMLDKRLSMSQPDGKDDGDECRDFIWGYCSRMVSDDKTPG